MLLIIGRLWSASLVHLAQDLLQVLAHVVGPLPRPVVPLQVLEEAEEQSVHGHLVDAEEHVGDEVGAHGDEYHRYEVVV